MVSYKTGILNYTKTPDLSCMTDLDFWECFREGKTYLMAELYMTDLDIWGDSIDGKTLFYS